jgi:hypothetical protein
MANHPQRFIAGLDLGQANDYTALAVLEQVEDDAAATATATAPRSEPGFLQAVDRALGRILGEPLTPRRPRPASRPRLALRHLERMRHQPYAAIAGTVAERLTSAALQGQTTLVVDFTGVGRAAVEQLTAHRLAYVPVTITGGESVNRDGGGYRVPKRELVSALQVMVQNGELTIARRMPLADVLVQELLSFRAKINLATGHDSYEAWRERDHDDLVLAVALAAWYAGAHPPMRLMVL